MSNKIFTEPGKIIQLQDGFYVAKNPEGKEIYLPGVTTILDVYPKGFGFNQWLKDVGNNAGEVVERAANIGSKIHEATEALASGKEIVAVTNDMSYVQDENVFYYELRKKEQLEEWKMLLRYKEFHDQIKPKLIANEQPLVSANLGYGGTIDRVFEWNNERWLIDVKTSNYLHKTHELQLIAYGRLWDELNPTLPINCCGILWLKAKTKTSKIDFNKSIYQGEGWQLSIYDDWMESFALFQHVHEIWKAENLDYKPFNKIYPDKIKL